MRRRLTRNLAGVDVAVWGIPFDAAVSNRPGARFGPQAVRRASAMLEGDPQYPFRADPFATLAVVDYGDCALDYGRHGDVTGQIAGQAREVNGRFSRRMRRRTAPSRSCSSTPTRTPGPTTASASTTARSSPAPCARA
jgi:arginase family enzyme